MTGPMITIIILTFAALSIICSVFCVVVENIFARTSAIVALLAALFLCLGAQTSHETYLEKTNANIPISRSASSLPRPNGN
jgi:hypothetical protein